MPALQLADIQGIILHGYAKLYGARFVLLSIKDAGAAKRWLGELQIRNAASKLTQSDTCQNIAFTHDGLVRLGLDQEARQMCSGEFQEGMAGSKHRQRILGDLKESDPEHWQWGGPHNPPVHILLMLYASLDDIDKIYQAHAEGFESAGLEVIEKLDTTNLPEGKEHFGFRDGISQPVIEGLEESGSPANTVAAGEFILGYANAYGQYTSRPLLPSQKDPNGLLPEDPAGPGRRDFGHNGSYLVFRQLSQDVVGFWRFVDERTRNASGSSDSKARIKLASEMVGRWPSGAPLIKTPDADNPAMKDENDFLYHGSDDQYGLKCPIGAHIRRSNPRDSLEPEPGSDRSIEVGKRHRIIRRGRGYGLPVATSMDPQDVLKSEASSAERGLHFICLNAHIGRQFEFIQHTWANNPKFDGLYADDDPLIGDRGAGSTDEAGMFTVQASPVRRRVTGMPRFVQVRGGAYFFMPGIRAVRFLAALP